MGTDDLDDQDGPISLRSLSRVEQKRTAYEDDGALPLPRDLPRPATPDLPEEDGDDRAPEVDEDVVEERGRERAALVEGHRDPVRERARKAEERRGQRRAQATKGGGEEDGEDA